MAATIGALTFDWYGTLASHRQKGRRTLFSEYLSSQGLAAAPWDRGLLYEVFDYYSRAYKPQSSDEEKLTFWTAFTKLLFERSQVKGRGADQVELHAASVGAICGSDCFSCTRMFSRFSMN